MKLLPLVKLASRAGRRRLERLAARRGAVLDRKTSRGAERLVQAVRRGGDAALLDAVRRFDGGPATAAAGLGLAVPPLAEAAAGVAADLRAALELAIDRVERFHRAQRHAASVLEEPGIWLEERRQPLRRVGVYVPGGLAAYPSTVIMTVVPAQVAGVVEIAVATPPGAYGRNPVLAYVLARLGIGEVWGMGGAHAVAALAYGTATVRRVDKIVGPGNAWVTAAKRAVYGDVAIDGLAGPTEVVIVAEASADPRLVAADLLAQAEHDPLAAPILVSASRRLIEDVRAALAEQLTTLATAEVARAALAGHGVALLVNDAEEALEVIAAIAPEHLQLVGEEAEALAPRVRAAGAIFLGAATAEVFGDYLAGPSHVLPTCGSARFASALGVEDFVKRSHAVRISPAVAARWAGPTATVATAEGLPAHAAAARWREVVALEAAGLSAGRAEEDGR